MDAIILAAGKGSRMAPLCTQTPKPMLPLAGRPILEHVLERAAAAGVTKAVLVVEYLADVIEQRLRVPDGMDVAFVRQGEPRGTGHAVAMASGHVRGDALVLMGDSLVATSTLQALANAPGFSVAAAHVDDPASYGALEVASNRVVRVHEKSAAPPSDLVNTGMYRVPADVLAATQDLKPSPRGELEFTDLLAGAQVVEATGWLDIGNPWQYLAAHEQNTGETGGPGMVEDGVHIRGSLWVEEGAVVKAGTYIEGHVHVGKNSIVGPNAYLRGPVQIGTGCKVGAASEIKNSILLDGANAPHHNYVGDSILGHGCNLGSGTKLANVKHTPKTIRVDWDGALLDTGRRKFGAVIGDHAKTGVNASINPGTILGVGAMVAAGAVAKGWVAPGAAVS